MAETDTRNSGPRVLGGRYEVGELIGRGGMAEVHIGHDTRLGRTVAIKILRSDLARDPAFQARFQREAQSAASLNYPAIVAVYDSGEDTYSDPTTGEVVHVPYIVMEYVEGHTVREILNHGDAVPIDEAVEITSGVLSALDYSHHAGIIHRDIKPGNVMITPTGSVKVMDFGIARAVADSAATMTQTQAVIGTAQYLSPEQARGETVDARSDIYSTGCLLFELLTGRPPFVGDSPVAVAYQHVGQTPLAPSDLAADVPPELDRITLKALAKERSQRYSSAAEFRADLDAFLAGQHHLGPVPHVVAPTVGATQVFHPGAGHVPSVGATQVFHPGVAGGTPPLDKTQHLGAITGPVSAAAGATAVYQSPFAPVSSVAPSSVPPGSGPLPHAVAGPGLPGHGGHGNGGYPGQPGQPWGPLSQTEVHPAPVLEPLPPEKSHKSHVALWILLPLAIVAAGLAAFFFARGAGPEDNGPGMMVAVPAFVEGVGQTEACATVQNAGFECNPLIDTQSNAPEGTFLRQDPVGGTLAEPGTQVMLWFSGGPTNVGVPNMEGMTIDQAIAALQAAGLTMDEMHQENSVTIPAGLVTRSQPAADHVASRGQAIVLYTSSGLVDVPDLYGQSRASAEATLNSLHIQMVPIEQETTAHAPGTVIGQSPAAGAINQGSQVTLTIAIAPPTPILTVPTLANQNCVEASNQLVTLGLQPALENVASQALSAGYVIDTRPAAGTELPAGETVTVVCSAGPGPAPTTPPPTTPPPSCPDGYTGEYPNCTPPAPPAPPEGGGQGGGGEGEGGGGEGGAAGRGTPAGGRAGLARDVELDGPDDGTTE